MRRQWVVAGMAGLAVAMVFGLGAVLAQSGEDGTGNSFLDRVAAKLGIESAKLEQAIVDTRSEDIDAAVAEGDLMQEQADRLKERLGEFELGEHGFGFEKRGHRGFGFGLHHSLEGLADFLGVEEGQLRDELSADGATLATVAEAHGKSRDELAAHITNQIDEKLAEAVADGKLTQETADEMKARLTENLDAVLDGEMPGPGFKFKFKHRGWGDGADDEHDSDDDDAAPQSGTEDGENRS